MKEATWQFASTGGSPDDGIHNSMIEHFAGNHNYHLAREIIQNSLDAKQDGAQGPVEVHFLLEYLDQKEFPGYSSLVDVLASCKKYWPDNDTQQFIASATKCLEKRKIPLLRISDFNTKGLSGGDFDKDGTWYKLVKSRGSSSKDGGQGGSFGIGKGAPFAASDLRVVFYASKNEKAFTAFQGICELVSFREQDDVKRGIGSFGEGQLALKNPVHFPSERFWRKQTGTDILIAGYKNDDDWVSDLTKSVLRNFWFAIYSKELVVKIENDAITSSNLEAHLTNHFFDEPLKDDIEPVGNPLQYYLTVTNGKQFSENLKTLGQVAFYFKETDAYLNHVAMMRRSHMVIYSRAFRFPGSYAGVFICDDEAGNKELRKMEPPAHDKWIVNRNPEKGKEIFNEITEFIRRCLEQSKQIKKSEVLDIPELHKYLPDNDEGEAGEGTSAGNYVEVEGKEETSKRIQKSEASRSFVEIAPYKVAVLNKKTNLPDDPEDPEDPGVDPSSEKIKKRRKRSRSVTNIRTRVFNSKSESGVFEYTVVLVGEKKAKYNLDFYLVGEDILEPLELVSVSEIDGQKSFFRSNHIKNVWLEKDTELRFTIAIKSKFKNALKLEVNEIH